MDFFIKSRWNKLWFIRKIKEKKKYFLFHIQYFETSQNFWFHLKIILKLFEPSSIIKSYSSKY